MQFVSVDIVFHEKQCVVNFFATLVSNCSEGTPNSFSSMDGLKCVLFVTLNQLMTSCEIYLTKEQSLKVCSMESCSPQYTQSSSDWIP